MTNNLFGPVTRFDLWQGDCLVEMARIPDGSVDMVVTSPPYDNLRTYNDSLEWSFDIFKSIARELTRCIKPGGVIVWNVADATIKGSETDSSFRQVLYFKDDCGLNLHDTMIWKKPNFANPASTRYHQTFEFMFVLSNGKPKTFNPIKDRKNIYAGKIGSYGENASRQRDGSFKVRPQKVNSEFGMRHDVWEMKTSGQTGERYDHPAVFPLQLPTDHIVSWSNPGDTVLDPFMGSGTTGVACRNTGRSFIGIEKDPEYFRIARERIFD